MLNRLGRWLPYWLVERIMIKEIHNSNLYLTRTAVEADEHYVNEVYLESQTQVNAWKITPTTWLCKTSKSELQKRKERYEMQIKELETEMSKML